MLPTMFSAENFMMGYGQAERIFPATQVLAGRSQRSSQRICFLSALERSSWGLRVRPALAAAPL